MGRAPLCGPDSMPSKSGLHLPISSLEEGTRVVHLLHSVAKLMRRVGRQKAPCMPRDNDMPAEIERRAIPRHRCPDVRVSRVVARPAFKSLVANFRDLSTTGVCLRCPDELPVGARLAIDWCFGYPSVHRTVMARVVRAAADEANRVWAVGCQFETPLADEEVQRLLLWDATLLS